MPIVVTCSCGKTLRARDELAGKRCRCPGCGHGVTVPFPVATATPAPHDPPATTAALLAHRAATNPDFQPAPRTAPAKKHDLPLNDLHRSERSWRGHVYWLLLLAIIPLVYSLSLGKPDIESIFKRTLDKNPTLKERIEREEKTGDGDDTIDTILAQLPGKRIEGAYLPR